MAESASASKDLARTDNPSRARPSNSRSRSRSPYSRRRDYRDQDRDERDSGSRRRSSRSRSPRSRSPVRGRDGSRSYARSRSRSRSRSPPSQRHGGGYSRSGREEGDRSRGGFNGRGDSHGDRGDRGRGRGRGRGGGPKHESTFRGGAGGSKQPEVWGAKMLAAEEEEQKKKPQIAEEDKEKPNFGLSGALAAETNTTVSGTLLKYNEPAEARKPKQRWRLYVFKGDKEIDLLHIHRQSAFLFGRDRNVVDIPLDHPSCSKQHAVLQFRQIVQTDALGQASRSTKPFIIDLESANGTFVNGEQIPPTRYYELKLSDVIKFGASTREFVLLHESAEGDA
ncbi:hypothetical protein BGZ99_009234 [Dissophora globulifera]|uniref:FHA domain-containing protein n=1 Tax=Dissophora globulifera TaxID=979702 RepID=A0A9P6RQX9_9FUNG|nr:hypothetical protein BGZ99_009234 [Dissophora globulifera]